MPNCPQTSLLMSGLPSPSIFRCFRFLIASLCLFTGLTVTVSAQIGGANWTPLPLNFDVHSPYRTNEASRFFATNGTYHCLLYRTDSAFRAGNTTKPRTEQRFQPDYTNGDIQYQARLMAPTNENSYSIFQIHTGNAQSPQFGATTFMLFWFTNDSGSVRVYSGRQLASHLGNQWFQLNVDHNVTTGTIKVWINSKLVWTQSDNGARDFYFKDGVYEQSHDPTFQMDTYISDLHLWTSPGTNLPAK